MCNMDEEEKNKPRGDGLCIDWIKKEMEGKYGAPADGEIIIFIHDYVLKCFY